MAVREQINEQLKAAMKAGEQGRVSCLRMINAKLKDADIAARPSGQTAISEEAVISTLRGMVKSRRESVELYKQGNRPELVEKELAEIAVIESFLPAQMDAAALEKAVDEAVAETGAASQKDMGKVMGVLKAKYAATLDMGQAGAIVKARLTA